jgi:hypothetical protein
VSEGESSLVIDESQGRACNQKAKAASLRLKPADGLGGLGGVKAAAREQSVTEQLEKSFPSTGEIRCRRRDWGQGGIEEGLGSVYTIYYAKRADAHPQADLFGGRGEGLGRLSGGVESSPTSGAREEPLF